MKIFNPPYRGIQNITDQDKQAVQTAFLRWAANRSRPMGDDIGLLFSKFHEYVYKSPKDKSCPGCVQFIFNYWQQKTLEWQQNP